MSIINQSVLNLDSINVDGENFIIEGLTDEALIYYNQGLYSATIGSNLSFASGILATSLTPVFTNVTGTILTASQPNVTSLGTLTSLTMGGNIDMAGYSILNYSPTIIGNLDMSNYKILNASTTLFNTSFGTTSLNAITSGTNNVGLGFEAGKLIDTGGYNTCIGSYSGRALTNQSYNTLIGYSSGAYANCSGSTGFGYATLANNQSQYTTAVGYNALYNNTTGASNNAFGYASLLNNVTGSYNTAMGSNTLQLCTNSNNTAIGYAALTNVVSGGQNTSVGSQTLYYNTSGVRNVALGYLSGYGLSGSRCISIGAESQSSSSNLSDNISIGDFSLAANVYGYNNVVVGTNAMILSTAAYNNVMIGYNSGYNLSNSYRNVGVGYSACSGITTGLRNVGVGSETLNGTLTTSDNVAIGDKALKTNYGGYSNCALGSSALEKLTSGYQNNSVGYQALYNVTDGFRNTALGYQAGLTVTTGVNNIYIGYQSDSNNNSNSGQILIGYQATSAVNFVCKILNSNPLGGLFMNSPAQNTKQYMLRFDSSTYEICYDSIASSTAPTTIMTYNPTTYAIGYFNNDGWIPSNETWTYLSADAPTFVFNVNADVTTKYSIGMKIRYVQSSTTKYGIITAVGAYASSVTPITIYGGGGDAGTYTNATSYTLANSAISANYYSFQRAPYGFPMSPITWSYILTNGVQYTKTSATYVEFDAALRCNIPIGVWIFKAHYNTIMYLDGWGNGGYWAQSTATNSVSNQELSIFRYEDNTNLHYSYETCDTGMFLNYTTKTILYTIGRTSGVTNVYIGGSTVNTILKATCAYL